MTLLVGCSVECLGGHYEASVGLAVAAVWESPIYFDRLEYCYALKVLLVMYFLYGFVLSGRVAIQQNSKISVYYKLGY